MVRIQPASHASYIMSDLLRVLNAYTQLEIWGKNSIVELGSHWARAINSDMLRTLYSILLAQVLIVFWKHPDSRHETHAIDFKAS